MYRPALILAVDPGRSCGVALLLHGHPVLVRTVRGDLLGHILAVIQHVAKLQAEHGMATVVLELQYQPRESKDGKRRGSNPKALATLYKRRHYWEILAEVYGLAVELVYPATWQTVLGEVPKLDAEGNKRTTKARARAYAEKHFKGKAKDDEQGDALAMGHWRWRQGA